MPLDLAKSIYLQSIVSKDPHAPANLINFSRQVEKRAVASPKVRESARFNISLG